jgi:hypothetical protein
MDRLAAIALATAVKRQSRDPRVLDLCDHVLANEAANSSLVVKRDRREYMKGYMRRWRLRRNEHGDGG